ncbi:MAG: DUF4177 domain-containing protein [Proteobacteria bacterium]|nr:DUF4177 domain-containing protein [Pseudomonadota bacterium]
MSTVYKVVELAQVGEEELEAVLNEWTAKGWAFDSVHFAMRESSKRPSMAFVSFTKDAEAAKRDGDGPPVR